MTPAVLWKPSAQWKEQANITQYVQWLKECNGVVCNDYDALWKWSVEHTADFWKSITEYFNIIWHQPYRQVISNDTMPYTKWFEGGQLNYAEHVFRNASDDQIAILFQSEKQPLKSISWKELKAKTAALQTFFLQQGVKPGDRIVAYLPNIPEATIALLATMSIGAVWSSCSPDFGGDSVVERFQQVAPKILIAADGYWYNGKCFDRSTVIKKIATTIPAIEKIVLIPYIQSILEISEDDKVVSWSQAVATVTNNLLFIPVPFAHPVWVLYSSGTTGMPKAITHSHGGVLLEHYKYLSFHNDIKRGEIFFWFTTTGWMMWNYIHAALLTGAVIVLYDGSPGYPDLHILWQLAEKAGIQHFGTSAPYIMACQKAGIRSGELYNLSALRSISSTGSPLPPEGFDYVYEYIKKEVWLCSMSGGTDVCTAFVGGCSILPVYEGEIQCRALGCDLSAWDEAGNDINDEVGEMVIKKPMPSMPVFFWNDDRFEKYLASYFDVYSSIWRHGDWLRITPRNGVVILGRSDATLNRQGVRIGTAEIYRAIDTMPAIKDSLIVNIELPDGGDYMPLFVIMKNGVVLTEDIKAQIKSALKNAYSPRHVPDEIIAVDDIPYTISGKKMETPIKRMLMGMPLEKSVNAGSVRNPASLTFFKAFAATIKK
jgi:acetoacetyl-CoA synthetase